MWAVRNEQFDDLDRESQRILFEEDELVSPPEKSNTPTKKN
ncbi:cbb3-type cytochrome oxidase assembly protein CcoS [Ketobacter sp.]